MNLEPTWFAEKPLDFEHKKWILLAYIQNIHNNFQNKILFPYLDDIRYHISNLEKWKTTRELYIKKSLKGIDWENLTLLYDLPENTPEMEELNKIVDWSYIRLQKIEKIGKILWYEIENSMEIKYHGIWINPEKEGSMLVQTPINLTEWCYKISPIISDYQISFTQVGEYNSDEISNISFKNGILIKTSNISWDGSIKPIIKRNLIGWINKF